MSDAPSLPRRADFPVHREMATRWMDNDHYGHVNNAVHYQWFDSAVNGWLIDAAGVDIRTLTAIGLVVETSCRYHAPISFPDGVSVGLGLERLGTSSVVYRLAIFREDDDAPAATGRFVHVYVDADTRRPVPVPDEIRAALLALQGA